MVPEIGLRTTRGGLRQRLACWPAPAGPRVLVLHGRSEFVEKYGETVGRLGARGFEVRSFDWRGQGLSDRLLPWPLRGHVADFDDYLDDVDEAVGTIPADGRPLVLLGHSMGGHVALRWLARRPGAAAAAVVTAPMVAIRTPVLPPALVELMARRAVRRGRADAYPPGQGDVARGRRRFAGNRVTGDPERFRVHGRHCEENPALRLGGVTWGWVDAAFRSMRRLRQEAARIDVPVLIALPRRDRVVRSAATIALARRMARAEVAVYDGARHEILMERDAILDRFWADLDGFLARCDLSAGLQPDEA